MLSVSGFLLKELWESVADLPLQNQEKQTKHSSAGVNRRGWLIRSDGSVDLDTQV